MISLAAAIAWVCVHNRILNFTIEATEILISVVEFRVTEKVSLGVARWYVYFKQKIQIWANFRESCNGRCWYISWPFCLLYDQLVHFEAIWYILWSFSIFFPVLVCCNKENLATLVSLLKCRRRLIITSLFRSAILSNTKKYSLRSGWPDWASFRLRGIFFWKLRK
jgi:hypothetical protein